MPAEDVVFTALFGKYETLNEIQVSRDKNTRYICFTDDPSLKSNTWEIELVEASLHDSPARSSRTIKMLGHKFFPVGTRSLYIDNTVRLKVDGKEILDEWLADGEIAFMQHYSRRTVRGEFFACSAYGLDDQATIKEQFINYRKFFKVVLKQRPHWGGMIARTNTPSTDLFMETWKQQFDLFTKRDQLSINVSSIISGVRIATVYGENDSSKWHEWPIHTNRRKEMRDSTSNRKFRKIRIVLNALRFGYRFYLPI